MDATDSRLSNSEPDRFLYDNQGMILPHSILGSLDNFRSYVELRGKPELLEKIPNSGHQFVVLKKQKSNIVGNQRKVKSSVQTNALEHWNTHMKLRRHQQDSLSSLLHRLPENLLMNHANQFRETQEKREMLNQVLPLVHSGYGHSVGSGFWRLPQHYGDETSGITSTLTKTERGMRDSCTQVGLPRSIRQESGLKREDIVYDASRAWDQSFYLKQQCQLLCEVTQDFDFKRPEIDKLEVTGFCKPFCTETYSNATLEITNKEEEPKDLHDDTIQQSNSVGPESKCLSFPAIRISGQLANWTGNSNANKCPTGELQMSHVELQNEGSTAIFYSWERLPLPHHLPHLLPHTKRPHFYFNTSSGVILPGETQKVECSFKSDKPGIQTELWQLNTHPILLQTAPIQVTLRGVALYQDRNVDHRLYIETKLEKKITVEICRSVVYDIVKGIHTPERPSSPVEFQQTEEQEFLSKNPKLFYKNQPVEELKKLWHSINPKSTWDLSVSALRQALVSSSADDDVTDVCLNQDTALAQLNSLLLQLTEPSPELQSPTVSAVGQMMWRDPNSEKTVDTVTCEAVWLTRLLQLPEKDTWININENQREEVLSEQVGTVSLNEEKFGKMGEEEKTVTKSEKAPVKYKDRMKGKESGTDLAETRKYKHKKEAGQQLQEQFSKDPAST